MDEIKEIMPELSSYLKKLSGICKDFPVCCQDSSIILYAWLKKNGIDCEIIAGDYEDPVIKCDSIHFWVETKNLIVDGTSVQFLLPDYDRTRQYFEIENLIQQTNFFFEKTNKLYKHKVKAYISDDLRSFMEYVIDNTSSNFDDFINEIKEYFYDYKNEIITANSYMMFSSLCKNNMQYYGLSMKQFFEKCFDYGNLELAKQYVVIY